MPPIIPAANGTKFILFIKPAGLNSPVYSEIPHQTKITKTIEAPIPDSIPLIVNTPAAISPAKKQHSERITYTALQYHPAEVLYASEVKQVKSAL